MLNTDKLTVSVGVRDISASRAVLLGRFLAPEMRALVTSGENIKLHRCISAEAELCLSQLWNGQHMGDIRHVASELIAVADDLGDWELRQRCARAEEEVKLNPKHRAWFDRIMLLGFQFFRLWQQCILFFHGFRWFSLATPLGRMRCYVAEGKGTLPPVILLHGFGAMVPDYTELMVRLRPHVKQVLAFDMAGHGMSEPLPLTSLSRDLFEQSTWNATMFLLSRCKEKPVLFGNSLGGLAALRLASKDPDRYRALFLASPAGARVSKDDYLEMVHTFKLEGIGDARVMIERLRSRRSGMDTMFTMGVGPVLRRPFQRAMIDMMDHEAFYCGDEIATLPMPITCFWPQDERILAPAHLVFLKSHLPKHTKYDERAGFGHFPVADDPDEFARIVVEFLRGLPV